MARDFDELLSHYGNDGTYQKWMIALVICPTAFFVAMNANLMLFQMAVPPHWCHTPGRERTKLNDTEWKTLTIPLTEKGEFSSCSSYSIEWKGLASQADAPFIIHNDTQACGNSWDYSTAEFTSTWATEYGWFCEKEEYSNYVYSASVFGSCIGTLILPPISDKYTGRRAMFFISVLLGIVFTLPVIWFRDLTAHIILRLLAGMAFETNYQMPYLIVLEVLCPEKRAMAACLSFVSWTVAMCFTSLVAWLVPRWDYLALISVVPYLICGLYWKYLPESPRWLLAHGKISECADVVIKIAKVNGNPVPSRSDLELELVLLKNNQKEDLSLIHAFKYPKLRRNTIILFIHSFACYLTYGITLLSINVLSSNFFLSHFVLSAFELPSNLIGWLLTHYLGRRFTLLSTVLLTAIFSLAACFCIHDKWALLTTVGFIKLFSTQYIYILIVMMTEILPTTVRATGFAWMTVCGLFAMMIAPYPLKTELGGLFPYILIIGIMVISLLIGWPLPETIGLPLPQTFQDSETLDEGRSLKTWIHHWNSSKYSSHKVET
ncbi:organic cation transporter 1-like [Macrobrachium rosenbergii]|uniref:organic cation transporter 1-like n=1 Tax=Macrobrachium rosenbergii TaxID=79674 RepID=UPI0034D6E514